jgi:hypothetical protein
MTTISLQNWSPMSSSSSRPYLSSRVTYTIHQYIRVEDFILFGKSCKFRFCILFPVLATKCANILIITIKKFMEISYFLLFLSIHKFPFMLYWIKIIMQFL